MTSEDQKNITTFKTFHILILGCLLSTFLVLNSNYVNDKRANLQLNEEKSILFDEIIADRHLEEQVSPFDKVCAKGSEDLVEYYKTGDLDKIGLGKDSDKEEKEPYVTSLINIIKAYVGEDNSKNSEGDVTSSGDSGRLRNLQSFDAVQDDLVNYVKHLLPILAFFVVAILAIPGWIICCFCCCCNCCCCCCCKKPGCKIPCFIFTNVFYALVVAVCIYGLSQSNNVFKGMASTECSILKFFEQFLDGETKKTLPRWAGITKINDILDDLSTQITDLKDSSKTQINNKFNNLYGKSDATPTPITGKINEFKGKMNEAGELFYTAPNSEVYNTDYTKDIKYFTGSGSPDYYVLDLVRHFGRHIASSDQYDGIYTSNSILSFWQTECNTISQSADPSLRDAKDGFDEILDRSSGTILSNLNDGKKALDELKGPFDDMKSSIADLIVDNSETIDDYGKLGFKCIFGVLGLINIAIAAFMFLICFFSGKLCANCCCCCRCIFKCATHLLWNILALLMILTFLIGCLVALIGQIGSDAMSVISFIVSEDNLGQNGEHILVDNLGDAKKYIDCCVNGDGRIEKAIGLEMNQINSFNQIYDAENAIIEAKKVFVNLRDNGMNTYNTFKDKINKRANLNEIPEIISASDITSKYKYDDILREMNNLIPSSTSDEQQKQEKWVIGSDSQSTCHETNADNIVPVGNSIFNPIKCPPFYRDWIKVLESSDIGKKAKLLVDIFTLVKDANNEPSVTSTSFLSILTDLNNQCKSLYLDGYIETLELFRVSIQKITGKLREFTGDNNGLFSFIKCSFVGTNLKIMLKYLKSALGGDVKTVGICLLVVGCSLMLSISATILMIVIINIDIDNNKKNNNGQVPVDSQGRVIQFK